MGERKIKEIKKRVNPFIMPEKLKVCAYVRVSTSHEEQLNSLQNQTDYYERKLKSNPDFEYCGIFSDSGISGAKESRPGFQAMMEKAKNGEIDLIITKSISRFARNTLMLLQYVRVLKEAGVGIIFEEQNINTLSTDGELMLTVLGAIAEEERKSVCSNVRWAMQKKFRRGEVMVNTDRLIGFDKDEDNKLVINKEQSKIVRKIFKLYLDGISANKIAKILNENKVPTYANKPWKSHRIISIISNEKYVGDCMMQKAFVNDEGREVINRGQKSKYYVKNDHPSIIKRKDWEKAQSIREERKDKIYPFRGLFRCCYCGASLIRVVHQGGYLSWICATYQQKGKATCLGMRISDGKLQEITKEMRITEPMVVEEVTNGQSTKNRTQKNFRLIPAAQYFRSREK